MRDKGVIYVAGHSLLNRCPMGVSATELTYIVTIVSSGALNSSHSFVWLPSRIIWTLFCRNSNPTFLRREDRNSAAVVAGTKRRVEGSRNFRRTMPGFADVRWETSQNFMGATRSSGFSGIGNLAGRTILTTASAFRMIDDHRLIGNMKIQCIQRSGLGLLHYLCWRHTSVIL